MQSAAAHLDGVDALDVAATHHLAVQLRGGPLSLLRIPESHKGDARVHTLPGALSFGHEFDAALRDFVPCCQQRAGSTMCSRNN